MILELVDLRIVEGQQDAFEAAVLRARDSVLTRAQGFIELKLRRGVESADRFVLLLHWETLENHTVDFRGGPLFAEWRAIVGPFFASPPVVEHFTLVGDGG